MPLIARTGYLFETCRSFVDGFIATQVINSTQQQNGTRGSLINMGVAYSGTVFLVGLTVSSYMTIRAL